MAAPGDRTPSTTSFALACVAMAVGLIGALTGLGIALATLFDLPSLTGATRFEPGLVIGFTLMVAGAALAAFTAHQFAALGHTTETSNAWGIASAAAFVAATIAIVAGSYAYFHEEEDALRDDARRELEAVSNLRLTQLVRWRNERFGDAAVLFANPSLEQLVRRVVVEGDGSSIAQLEDWLAKYPSIADYDRVFVLDSRGHPSAHVADREPPGERITQAAIEAIHARRVTMLDFYLDERDGRARLAMLIPLFDRTRSDQPIGVLALRIDPDRLLYPLVEGWPTARTTAETVVARRDGNDALYLTHLRLARDATLRLRVPLSNTAILVVKAVLGQTGAAEGADYAGHNALGMLRRLPESPWVVITKIDTEEFQTLLWLRFWRVVAAASLLLLGTAALLGVGWHEQRARAQRQQARWSTALGQSERRYRALVEQAPVAIFVNRADRVVLVNTACQKLFGATSPLDLLGKSPLDLFPPDEHAAICERIQKVLEDGEPAPVRETRLRRVDGSLADVAASAAAFDDNGVRALHVVLSDISGLKQAEAATRVIKERLELATAASRMGIWDWDVPGNSLVWDQRMFELYGVEASGFPRAYETWLAGIHPDDRARCDAETRRALDGIGDYETEFRVVWPGGAIRHLASLGRVFLDGDGRPIRMLGVNYDVTALRQSDLALRRSLNEKDALLKEVHHRVKNNLQIVSSLLRLDSGRSSDLFVRAAFREMQARIQSMALLHETLYASGEFGVVDLAAYLTELVRRLFRSLAPTSGALALALELEPAKIGLDQAIPCGLLVNELVSNSLKHAFPTGGGGTIRVALHPVDPGAALRLEVADDGVGLPGNFDERRTSSLGLQLVSDLAHQLGGELDMTHGPGCGFAVVFTPLPITVDVEQEV